LAPVVERFAFHFCGGAPPEVAKLKTNSPRWHLDFLLRCARSARSFLVDVVQPILSDHGLGDCAALGFFVRGLVALAREKLSAYNDDGVFGTADDALICQIVDETLSFERALDEDFSYSTFSVSCPLARWPRSIDLLAHYALARWVQVDALAAEAKFLELRDAAAAWDDCPWSQCSRGDDLPQLRPTRFAASFVSMLHAVTERYRLLESQDHQRYFVDAIQKPLLAEFRATLHQKRLSLKGGFTQANWLTFCSVLESLQCLCAALQDLSGDLGFAEMQASAVSPFGDSEFNALAAEFSKAVGGQSVTSCTDSTDGIGPTAAIAAALESINQKQGARGVAANMWGHLGRDEREAQTMYQAMLLDASKNIEVKFEHFTRGYAPWLASAAGAEFPVDDASPHFRLAMGWVRGFLDTAQLSLGQTTYDALGRATARVLNTCAIALVGKVKKVSWEMGVQLHKDFTLMTSVLVDDGHFATPLGTHFSRLSEVSRLLALPNQQLWSLLESSEHLMRHSDGLDDQADTHVEAMLATHGIHETTPRDALELMQKRARV
jgi:hypothetical protein